MGVVEDSESAAGDTEDASQPTELIIGLVTPIGTQTGLLAERIERMLSDCNYTAVVIRLSDLLPTAGQAPVGETNDQRITRLIAAGNDFCDQNNDAAAIARLAVKDIRQKRLQLFRQDNDQRPREELIKAARPRTAYILHSLKRTEEVELLGRIYAGQFILVGSQGSYAQRLENLLGRNLSPTTDEGKRELAEELMQVDAKDSNELGQNVSKTFPLADFFLNNDEKDVDRFIGLLFGEPIEPTTSEFAMYVARASSARSLAFSRKVGAAIVVDDAVISTGYNEVPHGQITDVLQSADTSERFKKSNLIDTLTRLKDAELLSESVTEIDADTLQKAGEALKDGELMGVIEYQRPVHAEAKAIDDATLRGVSPRDGTLYVTTYPCHLCYKHALSVRIKEIRYIDPYPKSRAATMFPEGSADRLVPFAGVAPRRYMATFNDREPFSSDPSGTFQVADRRVALPLLDRVRDDEDRANRERSAVNGLKGEFR